MQEERKKWRWLPGKTTELCRKGWLDEGLKSGRGAATPFTIKGERMLGDKRIRFIGGVAAQTLMWTKEMGYRGSTSADTRNSGAAAALDVQK